MPTACEAALVLQSAICASRRGQLVVIAIVFSAEWGHSGSMQRPEDILRVLLIILMLPWGAYSAVFAAVPEPAVSAQFASLVATPTVPEPLAMPPVQRAKIAVLRSCRKAVLAGSACSPDTVLPSNPRLHRPQMNAQVSKARERDALRGWIDSAPHGPPRAL